MKSEFHVVIRRQWLKPISDRSVPRTVNIRFDDQVDEYFIPVSSIATRLKMSLHSWEEIFPGDNIYATVDLVISTKGNHD